MTLGVWGRSRAGVHRVDSPMRFLARQLMSIKQQTPLINRALVLAVDEVVYNYYYYNYVNKIGPTDRQVWYGIVEFNVPLDTA